MIAIIRSNGQRDKIQIFRRTVAGNRAVLCILGDGIYILSKGGSKSLVCGYCNRTRIRSVTVIPAYEMVAIIRNSRNLHLFQIQCRSIARRCTPFWVSGDSRNSVTIFCKLGGKGGILSNLRDTRIVGIAV